MILSILNLIHYINIQIERHISMHLENDILIHTNRNKSIFIYLNTL